jgi:catechol 2,3-dioxygenase-like lactoylglutathione lyase family enzyme
VVIGMEEVPRPHNFTFKGAWFRGGSSELHLIAASETTAPAGVQEPGPGKYSGLATHIAFEITDLAAMRKKLEQHGVEIVAGPLLREDGAEQIYIHDPDGYMIEFFQWLGHSVPDAPERGAFVG